MKLQVDYAQAESWKAEGMNVPTECKNGCVYQMEGDDSGKFHVKHINQLILPLNVVFCLEFLKRTQIFLSFQELSTALPWGTSK